MQSPAKSSPPLRLGISSCLLGDRVRWDGDHDRRSFLADVLAPYVAWMRVCPELEIGLGVPREPIALVREGVEHVLIAASSRRDLTATMTSFAHRRVDGFDELDGYVLKSRSPSCGLAGARVYAAREALFADGPFERGGRGLYATALLQRWPALPIVEETQLETPEDQTHFVERCFAMRRARKLQEIPAADLPRAVAAFVEAHELQVLCRSADARKEFARWSAAPDDEGEAIGDFVSRFAHTMAMPPEPDRVIGVLRRIVNRLSARGPSSAAGWGAAITDVADRRRSALDLRAELRAAAECAHDDVLLLQTFLAPEADELAAYRAIAAHGPAAKGRQ